MADEEVVDSTSGVEPEVVPFQLMRERIPEYSQNNDIINIVKKRYKYIGRPGAINLISLVLRDIIDIPIKDIKERHNKFYNNNKSKFDKNKKLKLEEIKSLRREIYGFILESTRVGEEFDKEKHKGVEVSEFEGEKCFVLNKYATYESIRMITADEGGDVLFKYDFSGNDIKISSPKNTERLQRVMIQLLSDGIKFDYPIEFKYTCTRCERVTRKKAYLTACTNNKIDCQGIYTYLNPATNQNVSKMCWKSLSPDNEMSLTKDTYYYEFCYEDENGRKNPAGAISFERYKPGFYECVMFKIKNPKKMELYQIMDIKEVVSNTFVFPKKVKGENYVFALQRAFDKFIQEQSGMEVWGLIPIKIALIIQTAFGYLDFNRVANVQVVGDASTGKSTVLQYYLFLLNNHLNLSTDGVSVSVPAMRGTRVPISLMGKENVIVTVGYLGTFNSIHIDEAGENRELVQNLKTFLYRENYSYDKAGATGIFKKRTAHISVSENLDYTHLGQYIGMIRKAYKNLNIEIGENIKEDWDENWDLHQPIYYYISNPYLMMVVKEKRQEFQNKQLFWIDGYDFALHERFPFYFYLVDEKGDDEKKKLIEVVKGNVSRKTISENAELMRVLKTDDIEKFFISLKEYIDDEGDRKKFGEVDKILKEYDMHTDARSRTFYYTLVKVSRIINKRKSINKEDYDLLKWFLEKINRKMDITETDNYIVEGPSVDKGFKKTIEEIEDTVKVVSGDMNDFNPDDFDNVGGGAY